MDYSQVYLLVAFSETLTLKDILKCDTRKIQQIMKNEVLGRIIPLLVSTTNTGQKSP